MPDESLSQHLAESQSMGIQGIRTLLHALIEAVTVLQKNPHHKELYTATLKLVRDVRILVERYTVAFVHDRNGIETMAGSLDKLDQAISEISSTMLNKFDPPSPSVN